MNILVCIKPVPDPEKYSSLEINPQTKTLIREGIPTVINPPDKNAIEEAIRIRKAYGGQIAVLSMAPEFCKDKLVEGLAMGADEALLVSDRAFAGADTYVTSYVLAEAVNKVASQRAVHGIAGRDADSPAQGTCEDALQDKWHVVGDLDNTAQDACDDEAGKGGLLPYFDLILTGNESADGATAHVPAQLAEWLGLPHICNVNKIEFTKTGGDDELVIKVWKKTENGRDIFAGRLPALVAVSRDINKPRLINAMGIVKAKKKPLTIISNGELDISEDKLGLEGSPTQMGKLITPDLSRHAEDMGNDADAVADKMLGIIETAGV